MQLLLTFSVHDDITIMIINVFDRLEFHNNTMIKREYTTTSSVVCLAGAVANEADPDRCCNPKVPSSIPAGGKGFP